MKIQFFNNSILLRECYLPDEYIKHLTFGLGVVKEFCLQAYYDESSPKFENIYESCLGLEHESVTDIYLFFTDTQYYHYHAPLKAIYYRIAGYVNAGVYDICENLSFRFAEQIKIQYTNNNAFCDETCPYLDKDKQSCRRFLCSLKQYNNKWEICRNCFMENDSVHMNEMRRMEYESLRKKVADEQ